MLGGAIVIPAGGLPVAARRAAVLRTAWINLAANWAVALIGSGALALAIA